MFSGIKRFIGYVGVEETETHIIIEGLPGYDIMRDIQNKWQTSKINAQIFTLINKNKIVFSKFFAIDVLYIFNEMLVDRKCRTSKRLIEKIIGELYNKTWLGDIGQNQFRSRLNYKKLNEIEWDLLPHQMDFLHYYDRTTTTYHLNGLLLAAAPGSGKTITGIAISFCVEADVTIILSPKNALENVWEATIRDHLVNKPTYWVSKVPGEQAPLGCKFYAFHYEAMDRAIALAKTLKPGTKICIIIDESHNFNEIGSLRTQLLIELCKITRSDDVIWASGTPVKAIGSECIPMLKTIDSKYFNKEAEERFRKIFGKDAKRALDILRNRIGIVSFKINKQEVVKGEVDVTPIKVKIPNGDRYTLDAIRADMTAFIDERRKFYKERMSEYRDFYAECLLTHKHSLETDSEINDLHTYNRYIRLIRENYDPVLMKAEVIFCNKYELQKIIPSLPDSLRKEFKSVRSVIKYVDLKIMGEALGGILGKRRSQCHVDMIPYMDLSRLIDLGEKKTVIFTSYVEVVDRVADHVADNGYNPLKVYGDTNKNLNHMVQQFGKAEDINPLIATYQSLSTAVPLIMANNMIMTNAPFRDHEREQAISRCDRLGQDHAVHVYDIFLDTGDKPNISTRSKDILDWSRNQVEAILGVTGPNDLETTLEAMMNDPLPLEVSQEHFLNSMSDYVKTNKERGVI